MRFAPLFAAALLPLLTACKEELPAGHAEWALPDGGRYRGEQAEGRMQGQGRVDYPNGAFYEGAFHAGQWHGHGRWRGANGDEYRGTFEQGLFHGLGDLTYADGARYSGAFAHGRLHGQGVFEQPGLRYAGGFADDLYEGRGTLDQDDEHYAGTFHRGHLQGPGEFRNAAGDHYLGEFQDGLFHGEGRYQSADGEVWSGTFVAGELTGDGRHEALDGSVYEGRFDTWVYQGQGRLTLPDGRFLEGTFVDGRLEGSGLEGFAEGRTRGGLWRSGRRLAEADGRPLPDAVDLALLNQGALLEAALEHVSPSTPEPELYTLVVAGDGRQSVFLREAGFVSRLLRERFAAHGQVTLVNHRNHLADRAMATREGLARAIEVLAERSGPEDLVLIYLTSHGSPNHELVLDQPGLNLASLSADELAWLLRPLEERDTVVIVSACYSGGFVAPLKSERRLVMTAARADRTSFGCSEDANFTYFGRALFSEALQRTQDLEEAFEMARRAVEAREKADDFEPSEPQLWAPEQVLARWRTVLPD